MDSDLKKFIDRYIKRGFGSMNKNDFEVEIFHYMQKNDYFESQTDYDISIKLRIPQSKVKRLKYESGLKFPDDNKDETVKKILGNAKIYFDKECLVLSIEDELIRKHLDCEIKKHNSYSDLSFNTELLRLNFEDYIYLVGKFEGKNKVEETKKKLETWLNAKDDKEKAKIKKTGFKDLFFEFAKGFVNEAGSVTANLVFNGMLGII